MCSGGHVNLNTLCVQNMFERYSDVLCRTQYEHYVFSSVLEEFKRRTLSNLEHVPNLESYVNILLEN